MLSRRHLFRVALAAAAVPLLRLPTRFAEASGGPESDWPCHGFGPEARRWNSYEKTLDASNVDRLALVWEFEAGSAITGTPAVVGDRVVVGSWDGRVHAVDRRSGKLVWSFDAGVRAYPRGLPLGVTASPAIADGRVIVVCDRVIALDLENGKPLWQRTVGDPERTLEYFWSPPLVHGGRVFAGASSAAERITRPTLVCLDAADGRVLWSFHTVPADVQGGAFLVTPSLDPATNTLYVATGSPYKERPGPMRHANSLLAFDAATGKLQWADQVHPHDTRDRDLNLPPVLIDDPGFPKGLIVAGGRDGARGWDRASRERLWHVQLTPVRPPGGGDEALNTTGPEGGPLAAEGTRVFFASNNHSEKTCHVAALDAPTGEIRWIHSVPSFEFSPMSVAGGVVYMGLANGRLRAWRTTDGKELWVSPETLPIYSGPAIARGMVFHGTAAPLSGPGKLLAWAPDGKAT